MGSKLTEHQLIKAALRDAMSWQSSLVWAEGGVKTRDGRNALKRYEQYKKLLEKTLSKEELTNG